MEWHALTPAQGKQDVEPFEAAALTRIGLDGRMIPSRYRTPYFRHIWSNGYSAGYYSYIWTEMLAHDAWHWVETHGGPTRANGDHVPRDLPRPGPHQGLRGDVPRLRRARPARSGRCSRPRGWSRARGSGRAHPSSARRLTAPASLSSASGRRIELAACCSRSWMRAPSLRDQRPRSRLTEPARGRPRRGRSSLIGQRLLRARRRPRARRGRAPAPDRRGSSPARGRAAPARRPCPVGGAAQVREQRQLVRQVERGERLVGEDPPRLAGEHPREQRARALAARERRDRTLGQLRQVDGRERRGDLPPRPRSPCGSRPERGEARRPKGPRRSRRLAAGSRSAAPARGRAAAARRRAALRHARARSARRGIAAGSTCPRRWGRRSR